MTVYAVWHNHVGHVPGNTAEVVAFDLQGRGAMDLLRLMGGVIVVVTEAIPLVRVESYVEGVSRRVAERMSAPAPGDDDPDRKIYKLEQLRRDIEHDDELAEAIAARFEQITDHWYARHAIACVRRAFFDHRPWEDRERALEAHLEEIARTRYAKAYDWLLAHVDGLREWVERQGVPCGLAVVPPQGVHATLHYEIYRPHEDPDEEIWRRDHRMKEIRGTIRQWLPRDRAGRLLAAPHVNDAEGHRRERLGVLVMAPLQ